MTRERLHVVTNFCGFRVRFGGGGGRAINSLSVTLYLLIYWISAAPVTNPQNGINEHRPNATNITDTEPDGPSSYRHNHRAVQPEQPMMTLQHPRAPAPTMAYSIALTLLMDRRTGASLKATPLRLTSE